MAENDPLVIRATRSRNQVAIHRHHEDGKRTMVGYYSLEEAERIGMEIIRAAGEARNRIAAKQKLKSAA